MRRRTGPGLFWKVFALPLAIALISIVGLAAALIGDGPLDVTSWLALGLPIAVIVWACRRRSPR